MKGLSGMRPRIRHILGFGKPKTGVRGRTVSSLALVAATFTASIAGAQTGNYRGFSPGEFDKGVNQLPVALEGIDVEEKRGASLPLDAVVIDSDGRRAALGEYFDGKKPVLLNLVYFECPMLCGLVMADTTRALRESKWEVGEDYTVLTISFDHTNSIADAAGKKAEYASAVRRDGVMDGWKYFVTTEADARRIADSVGFHYKRLPNGEFSHPSVQMVLTPSGTVSTYLYGLYNRTEAGSSFTKQQLELSLLDAADGKLGGIFDKISFFCYVHTGEGYAFSAFRFMQLMGAVTVVVLTIFIGAMFLMERRRRARKNSAGSSASPRPATA
jgi:protein SCO1/2